MSLNTTPNNPPQPSLPTYNFDMLATVPTYSRSSYLSNSGVQASNWADSKTPDPVTGTPMPASLAGFVKLWAIRDGVTDPTTLMVEDLSAQSGSPAMKPLTILDPVTNQPRPLTVAEMGAFNIPGLRTYVAWVPAASQVVDIATGDILSPIELSTQLQAFQLAVALGLPAAAVQDGSAVGTGFYQYPASEPRRRWQLNMPGATGPLNVGRMLAQEYALGVGYPGHWDLSVVGNPNWANDPLPPTDGITTGVGTIIPTPKRALLPATEYFERLLIGSELLNTNLAAPPSAGGGTVSAGDFTAADRANIANQQAELLKIQATLLAICKVFGVSVS